MAVERAAIPQSYYIARRGKNEKGESGFWAYWYFPSSGREDKSGY
jgi:hypothetical protein